MDKEKLSSSGAFGESKSGGVVRSLMSVVKRTNCRCLRITAAEESPLIVPQGPLDGSGWGNRL